MRKKVLPVIALLISVYFLSQPNFGFHPLDGAESLGRNVVPIIVYLETIWLVYGFIKGYTSKRNK